jgi:hypothetical protein
MVWTFRSQIRQVCKKIVLVAAMGLPQHAHFLSSGVGSTLSGCEVLGLALP